MSEEIRQASTKRKKSALTPLMGLVLAIALAVAAFFSAPLIVDLMQENIEPFAEQTEDISTDRLEIVIAGIMWLLLLSVVGLIAAASAGGDTLIDKEGKIIMPRGRKLSERELQALEKKVAQQRQEKIKALKKLKAKKEQAERSGKRNR
ncbi:MAG: hypothetical protein GYB66_07970 [Chloroflexi bacterium]|nr:hypothetical protein [Chloroflexota bacterium]